MKVLWFTPIPPKVALERRGSSGNSTGFWIHALIDQLAEREDFALGVCYEDHGTSEPFSHQGVEFFPVPAMGKLQSACNVDWGHARKVLGRAGDIIRKFQPDVVHVHGFESVFGLLKAEKITNKPVVVSIQGLMKPCAQVAWGDKSFWEVARIQRWWDAMRGFPSLRSRRLFERRAIAEAQAIKTVDAVLGRTDFDRSFAWSISPQTKYFMVGEILRDGFYAERWACDASEPFTIIASGRLTFQKGIHRAIEAAAMLKPVFPQLKLKIVGSLVPSGECLYIQRYAKQLGLAGQVEFLGWLPEPALIRELKSARVYLNPSFMENSSNALAEAMLLGMPCVASLVGGTGSQITHGKNGILYPVAEAAMLADSIRELLENPELAVVLGNAARNCARPRHDRNGIMRDLLAAYCAVRLQEVDGKNVSTAPVTSLS